MADTLLQALVTVDAVQAQLGESFAEPERAQVEIFVSRAQAEMLNVAPALNLHLANSALNPVLVSGVGVDIVIRAVENVRIGYRVTEETYPDVSTRFAEAPEEFVYLTAAEVAKLHPAGTAVVGRSGAYIVSLSG